MPHERYRMMAARAQKLGAVIARLVILPAALYVVLFALMTYPWVSNFSTRLFAEGESDALINVWNLWWFKHATTVLHVNPWHTTYWFFPQSCSLLAHTLCPFAGMVYALIALCGIQLTPLEAHNLLVVLAFVLTGWTLFLACWMVTRSVAASLVGGGLYTFSLYHFAHAAGHMNLIHMEWIPVFFMTWVLFLQRGGWPYAVGAALALFLTVLCDYYYFFYCVLGGALTYVWLALRARRPLLAFDAAHWKGTLLFLFVVLATSGVLVAALLRVTGRDPVTGSHDPLTYSSDLVGLFVPGECWRFSEWTRPLWKCWKGNGGENSVNMGMAALILGIIGFVLHRRQRKDCPWPGLAAFLACVFSVLSLGPALHIGGTLTGEGWMPYAWLAKVVPPLDMSGVPARMIVVSLMAVSMLASMGVASLGCRGWPARTVAGGLIALAVFECWPNKPHMGNPKPRPYVAVLASRPLPGGLLDMATPWQSRLAEFEQTVHQKPLAHGHPARMPRSCVKFSRSLGKLLASNDIIRLVRDCGYNYFLTRRELGPLPPGVRVRLLCQDSDVRLYELTLGEAAKDVPDSAPGLVDRADRQVEGALPTVGDVSGAGLTEGR